MVRSAGLSTLILLTVFAVVGDVEATTLEQQAATARNNTLRHSVTIGRRNGLRNFRNLEKTLDDRSVGTPELVSRHV